MHARVLCMTRISLAVLLASLMPVMRLAAQGDGTPIRIQTAAKPGKWITGLAIGITPDSVGIIPLKTQDTLRYPRSALTRMEVSAGRKSNAGRGALIGGAVGGGLMVIFGAACAADTNEDDYVGCEGSDVPMYGLVGAATGAAVGALIGALSHREKWEEVRLEPTASRRPHGTWEPGRRWPAPASATTHALEE